jgi:hypothetical protein
MSLSSTLLLTAVCMVAGIIFELVAWQVAPILVEIFG